ncbi:flagellar biosynthetic protein FliR [Rhodobacter aestuarii]|uniref:Flagellar biosynthetic protein FliR n=1 Tax=Rhodobacter aestuarii TaxID=453582 RepID=A0A1N7LG13_9RHOB|nr:flagellar biosynthetic protein FliR [Rhodobacter aestuarii]PTV95273.1 flagellar biosynthetic protein FliR [Rhodobacter aestuarii]SIS72711.1 flagellar biosynthetic protein FliR [Rhodobacter aestuarii]
MNPLYAEALQSVQGFLWAGFIVFLRIGGAMLVLPAFGEMLVPARVKLVLAFAFTLIVLPGAMPYISQPETNLPAPVWLFAESLIGLAIGMTMRMFVLCLQIAGMMAAQSVSLSQLFGGTTGEPQPAVGQLLVLAGLAIAVHMGLHIRVTEVFIGSYQALPPGTFPDADLIRRWELSGVARAFTLGFSIAAPFVIAGLVYNIALGAINRAMPQLMVAFVGAPALTLGGLALLMVALPSGLLVWHDAFVTFLSNPFEVRP